MTAGPVRGRIHRARAHGEPALEYLSYCPESARPDGPLLVAVHGYSRNAGEQAEHWAPLCEAAGAVLAAPRFDAQRFPSYQRLGSRGARADRALDEMISDLRRALGMLLGRVALFGFSGGGQFVHRYALAYPSRVATAAIAAPGWFTFPCREQSYPFGLRGAREKLGVRLRAEAFSRVPLLVAVGEHDDQEDAENMRRSPQLDAQQGTTRLERALRWSRAMRRAAREAGCRPRIRFELIPDAGHSFSECMQNGLGELVLAHAELAPTAVPSHRKCLTALP